MPKTKIHGPGFAVCWFERPTDATVALTYLLKFKGTRDAEWIEQGIFSRIAVPGERTVPELKLRGKTVEVHYLSADIVNFSNHLWVRTDNGLSEVRIKLVESDEEKAEP